MTFTLPEQLAGRFTRAVPARYRSQVVAEAVAALLAQREQRLIDACDIANADADLLALESDFDALPTDVGEPWSPRETTDRPPAG